MRNITLPYRRTKHEYTKHHEIGWCGICKAGAKLVVFVQQISFSCSERLPKRTVSRQNILRDGCGVGAPGIHACAFALCEIHFRKDPL